MPEPQRIRQESNQRTKTYNQVVAQRQRIFKALTDAFLRNGVSMETYDRLSSQVGDIGRRYLNNMTAAARSNRAPEGWRENMRFARGTYRGR